MNLHGRACVVTGASSGIGLETVKLLSQEGGRILAVARNVKELEGLGLPGVIARSIDVSTAKGVDLLFATAVQELGTIEVFFANAGFAYCETTDQADWAHLAAIMDLNLLSPIYSLEKLRQLRGGGVFYFLSTASAMSYMSLPGYAVYGATKAGLRMFNRTAAYELGPGQAVGTLYPVATKTRFFDRAKTSYQPKPAQEARVVAKAVIRAMELGSESVFPFRAFPLVHGLFSLLPPLRRAYLRGEWKKTGLAKAGA